VTGVKGIGPDPQRNPAAKPLVCKLVSYLLGFLT
jgi:hypothetical protein